MFKFFRRMVRLSRMSRLPPAASPAEAMWNEKTHNQALAGFPGATAQAIRESDMKSKAVYDGMDHSIQQLRDVQVKLAERKAVKVGKIKPEE